MSRDQHAHVGTTGESAPPDYPSRPDSPTWDGLDEAGFEEWQIWSSTIGRTVLPRLQRLADRQPDFTSAMLCTADGFNLCALGLEEGKVGGMAALCSSLYSVSTAARSGGSPEPGVLDMVSLAGGASQMILIALDHSVLGHLLLWVAAENTTIGLLLVNARAAADEIRELLGTA